MVMVKEHRTNAAALVAAAFAFVLACCFLLAPLQQAFGLDVVKCTARVNAEGSNEVLGGTETRVTWEGQAAAEEQVAGLSLTFPAGTSFSGEDARITMKRAAISASRCMGCSSPPRAATWCSRARTPLPTAPRWLWAPSRR